MAQAWFYLTTLSFVFLLAAFILSVHYSLQAVWLLQLVICPLPSLTLSSVTIGCHSTVTSVTTYASLCPLFFPLRQQILSSCAQSIYISLWAKTVIDSWHLFPDVPSLPTQLPARINPLCRGKAKYREGADRRASPEVWRGFSSMRCIVVTHCSSFLSTPCLSLFLSVILLSSLRCQRWAVCRHGALYTGRYQTRACAATARAHRTPARTAPCWTKPCLTTSYSAPPHLTTARCLLAWSTTREHPTWGVSLESKSHFGKLGAKETPKMRNLKCAQYFTI